VSNLFPQWTNLIPTAAAVGLGFGSVAVVVGTWYYATPDYMEVGYMPTQPVDYSHQIHAGKLGMDCRYCHSHVEESYVSNVPDTATCMNCHTGDDTTAYLNSDLWKAHKVNKSLSIVRTAFEETAPIEWRKVHKLPDYAHFPHAAHVNAGVSCYSCHGRIDQMPVVYQTQGLGMGWCLDCHRAPEKHLVDVDGLLASGKAGEAKVRITDLDRIANLLGSEEQKKRGAELAEQRQIEPPQHCGACHY